MTTMKAVFTSLVIATFTTPVFAKSFVTANIPSGQVTIQEIGRGTLSPSLKAQLFSYDNDCSKQPALNRNHTMSDEDGGVVFDDGVSGTIVTGDPRLDVILNLGKQAWQLIQANAPVVTTKLATAHALPQGIQCWNQLEKWQAIRSVDYKIVYKSWTNADAIVYVARVIYAYGGSYKGKGRYIANAAIQNKQIMVKATNVLNVDVEVANVLNVGSAENPVAVMQLNLNVEAKNKFLPLKHFANSVNFVLFGDGRPLQIDGKKFDVIK
jgi:hypothetical protein